MLWLLFFTLELIAKTMQSVVTKSAEALGKSGKPKPHEIAGGEARCFPPYFTRDTRDEGAQKVNQFANWTNIAAGIHSIDKYVRTASEFRLFPQLTNSWLLTTDHQYIGYYSCCLEYCLYRTKSTV